MAILRSYAPISHSQFCQKLCPTPKLNETWNHEGREPKTLGTWEGDLPDLDDPRLERCVTAYFTKNRNKLEELRVSAVARWEELKTNPQIVDSRAFTPGELVELIYSSTGAESDAIVKGTYAFAGIEDGRVFLVTPDGAFDIRIGFNALGPARHWLLPVSKKQNSLS
jgi:hypothetical protein